MARTALLTVGRFPAALTLARGLHEHGVRVIVADPLKRQLCSVSRAVAKTFQVAPPNTDIEGWERDILDIIERENVTDLIPTSEEVCHVANLAPVFLIPRVMWARRPNGSRSGTTSCSS